ncbi:MAG: DegT/DnrJ/EryC1/StrS family aminotransferase, partial [Muribaculaceae bacterium]|nr:DegT/DnrJ/EryC1/StrS family aminotransferase [Muribaculaceae bacterium]
SLKVKGEEDVYKRVICGAVCGAAGVVHKVATPVTDCQPNNNVEAMRMALDRANVEARPLWKPMHCQPVYRDAPAYLNGVSESLFFKGLCLPAGPYVTDDDVRYIVNEIKSNIIL